MGENYVKMSGRFETFVGYWTRLREGQGGIPKRSTLNPVAISDLLPFIFLIERYAQGDLRVRLSGTALDKISPAPMTGANYLDLCPPGTRRFVMNSTTAICEVPCGHRLKRKVTFSGGKSHEIATVALPMASESGEYRYIIGISASRTELLPSPDGPEGYVSVQILHSEFMDLGAGIPVVLPTP